MARVRHSWEPDVEVYDVHVDRKSTRGEVEAAVCGLPGIDKFTGEASAAAGDAVAQHLVMLNVDSSGACRPAVPRLVDRQPSVSVKELLEPIGAPANARTHCTSTVLHVVCLCVCACTQQHSRCP